jgi:hypothetical protein
MFYAYYGDFKRIAGRVCFKGARQARTAMWNDGTLFGLHAESECTAISRKFEAFGKSKKMGQRELSLPIMERRS